MSMIAALVKRYESQVEQDKAPLLGYSNEKISYGILINREGEVVGVEPLGEIEKGKRRPKIMSVPQAVIRTAGISANLLWDKTAYVFGMANPEKPSKRAEKRGLRTGEEEFQAFKGKQIAAIGETSDPGLRAFLRFLEIWAPERCAELPHAQDMLDTNVVFRLDGEEIWLHDRPAARAVVARASGSDDAPRGRCLVSGEDAPIARLHPSIKGVRDAQSSGAAIVSFNKTSFTSYGKEQGANAPIAEFAAFAYTTALNGLLADQRHRVQIGDASVVFWAEPREGQEQAAEAATDLLAQLFGGGVAPEPDADAVEMDLLTKLTKIAQGRPTLELSVDSGTKFFVLGLSPNAARISVRFWLETSLGELAARLIQYYEDLHVEPLPWKRPPNFWRLLLELGAQRKAENIPAHLAGEFARAVLGGTRFPLSLLTLAITRLRADHEINGHRVALIKACLTRSKKEVPVSLARDEQDPGYCLGRLFAVLEMVQRAGVGDVNAGIRDRYVGAASATPARVFPILLRGAQNHLSAARKKGRIGWAINLEKEISQIMSGLDAHKPFPATLNLDRQGRFFVGFYHQNAELYTKHPKDADIDDIEE